MDRYQHAKADGHPDWTVGQEKFGRGWDPVEDKLRFHMGEGYRLSVRKGPSGKLLKLKECPARVLTLLEDNPPDTPVHIRSESDAFTMLMRRHDVPEDKGELVIAHAEALLGYPYHLGLMDCSGLTKTTHGEEGVELPHNARQQHDLFRAPGARDAGFFLIERPKIQRGDLLFHHDDAHVSMYYGMYRGSECVIDTEPSDAAAPWGGMLGVGVRVRPMTGGYYCADVEGIGRILAINGKP